MYLNDYTRHAQSADHSRRRIQRLGITPKGHRIWTPEEDETCRLHGHDYGVLQRKLPHRTYYALRQRCRFLGLRPKRQLATAREISLLRKLSPIATADDLRAAFPDRKPGNIRAIGRYYGIKARRRPFSPTGFPVIDAIRSRCFELNYSMVDLDVMARSKRYFRDAKWLNGGLNYRAIGRAVAALDGELTVRWRDE